ncbi:hypothetical protein EBU91_01430 [bacterium]|nr:hypothetical protein [bacterium]
MTYNLKKLNVASLDFENISQSLISFLEVQPGLTDIAFRDKSSTANLLINILATATAYNGVYAQFGFTESFASTATLLESLISIGSNNSILFPITQSASAKATTVQDIASDYTSFSGKSISGQSIKYFIKDAASAGEEVTVYSSSEIVSFTNYDYESQSILLPAYIDPNTINFYTITDPVDKNPANREKWTRVDKSNKVNTTNNKHYTVVFSSNGYLVTNNFQSSSNILSNKSVIVNALVSNGTVGNSGTLLDPEILLTNLQSFSGGYNNLTIDTARAKLLFESTGQQRCVTINDYRQAIIGSGIAGTDDEDLVSVRSGDVPGQVNIFVTNLSEENQGKLLDYIIPKSVLGITVVYGQ